VKNCEAATAGRFDMTRQEELDMDHLARLDLCRRFLEPIEFFEQEHQAERLLLSEIRERLIRLADSIRERMEPREGT
jgi:hypothetical protein